MPDTQQIANLRQRIVARVLHIEGGYVNDPNDSGGETNFGVTAAVARSFGYDGPMIDMPRDVAVAVYEDLYWHRMYLDRIAGLSPPITEELVDTAINMGVGVAGRFLQRALNALNNRARFYPDLVVDGLIGPLTVGALEVYLVRRARDGGETVMLRALNSLQGARYIEIAERREKDETFVYGWLRKRVA